MSQDLDELFARAKAALAGTDAVKRGRRAHLAPYSLIIEWKDRSRARPKSVGHATGPQIHAYAKEILRQDPEIFAVHIKNDFDGRSFTIFSNDVGRRIAEQLF